MRTFLQLYRLLSAYKLFEPPQLGNCRNKNLEDTVMSIEDIKTFFSANDNDKLDCLIEGECWQGCFLRHWHFRNARLHYLLLNRFYL